MKFLDHIPEQAMLPRLKCHRQDEVIATLVASLGAQGALRDPDAIVAEILRREEQDCTAIGRGLAVPHTCTDLVDNLLVGVATLEQPLPIPAADDQPVDVFVLIVGPTTPARLMIQVLASLTRLVRSGPLLEDLRQARSAAGMRATLAAAEARLT